MSEQNSESMKKCQDCKRERLEHTSRCWHHFVNLIVRKSIRWSTREVVNAAKLAFDLQNGRCSYTGINLVPDINASLDHIMPVSRYPDLQHDFKNLEWVDLRINVMKGNMTRVEFLKVCEFICQRSIDGDTVVGAFESIGFLVADQYDKLGPRSKRKKRQNKDLGIGRTLMRIDMDKFLNNLGL